MESEFCSVDNIIKSSPPLCPAKLIVAASCLVKTRQVLLGSAGPYRVVLGHNQGGDIASLLTFDLRSAIILFKIWRV
jgi:hypothetical protein